MECPKCHQALTGIDFQGVHIETCPTCGGDWLDSGQLNNIVRARQARFSPQECVAVAQATKITGVMLNALNRHLICPKCGGTTHPVNYGGDSGIIIDECATCNGVWLERGEIDKIEELVQGWEDELPDDLAKYGDKMRQVAADVNADEQVHLSHFHLINSMINGILDLIGD